LSGDSGLDNDQNNVVRDDLPDVGNTTGAPGIDEYSIDGGGEPPQGFLEIVYGVLFEPVKTMKRAAENPPLVTALVFVTILSLLGTLAGLLTFSRVLSQSLDAGGILPGARAFVPVGAFIGLVFSYIKWFGYSAVLHLTADLLGGRGGARGVFAAVGLAGLPYILLIPFQFLGYWYGLGKLAVTALLLLAGLAVGIWSSIILVIGVREVHLLSTGRSVLVFFIPFLALLMVLILSVIALAVIFSALPLNTSIPGYF
jgi:hypothetical protein